MTDPFIPPSHDLTGVRLSDMVDRRFSFGEIAEEIGAPPDTLRSWFLTGGLVLAPALDEVAAKGGAAHRLHWRSAVILILALKLNDLGFSKTKGEAAAVAGGAFRAGLEIEHFETTDGPLIAVSRDLDGTPRVYLVDRASLAGEIEGPSGLDGFAGIGTVLIDPIRFGRIVWRMGWRQVQAEAAAVALEGMRGTFSAEEIAAAEEIIERENAEAASSARAAPVIHRGPITIVAEPEEITHFATHSGRDYIKGTRS